MITIRRAKDRHHERGRKHEVWHTFSPNDRAHSVSNGLGALEILDEGRLSPGGSFPGHPRHHVEILTFVHEGAVAREDSLGRSGVLQAGEFQRMTAGPGLRHRVTNASRTGWAHLIQIWLRPAQAELEPSCEQRLFSRAERRGRLCVFASHDGRRGSLRVHQDALLYSALLDPGTHVVHELTTGRSAWLHLVEGEALLEDVILSTGDGAGLTKEHAVSLTAQEQTEILLVDLGGQRPLI